MTRDVAAILDRAADLPWSDCKVAFGIDDDQVLWDADREGALQLPPGWSLTEIDGSGCRYVAVFRVEGPLRIEDGELVQQALREAASLARSEEGE